jgi:tetratricopeptide (TPR) repeat protein
MHRFLNASSRAAALFLGLALAVATTACRSEYKRHCDLGKQLRNEERYEEAIKEYELAAKIAPNQARPYENIAKIYKHQGKYDVAANYYRQALEVDPTYIDAYAQWAKMLRLAGKIDEASKIARGALQKIEVKRDMKATREIQEQMVEIDKARKAKLAPPPEPPTVGAPTVGPSVGPSIPSTTPTVVQPPSASPNVPTTPTAVRPSDIPPPAPKL